MVNVVRGDRLSREIDEEMRSHIEEAIGEGRDPAKRGGRSVPRSRRAKRAATSGCRMARIAACGHRFRLAAAHEAKGDVGGGGAVYGAGNRGVQRHSG
jgi:hypothetical protein